MNDQITSLPTNLAIDLDATERPADEVKPPFTAKIDPSDLDWRDLLAMQDPREFIRLTMSAEDREHLSKTPIPGWKFGRLMEAFYLHYDLEELAEKARRESTLRPV
jgi:hypothetical protein